MGFESGLPAGIFHDFVYSHLKINWLSAPILWFICITIRILPKQKDKTVQGDHAHFVTHIINAPCSILFNSLTDETHRHCISCKFCIIQVYMYYTSIRLLYFTPWSNFAFFGQTFGHFTQTTLVLHGHAWPYCTLF